MDSRAARYMYESQQNVYSLIRLMILQEQNLRYMMSNNARPERQTVPGPLSFLSPSTPTPIGPVNTGVQATSPRNNESMTSEEIIQTTTNLIYQDIENPINSECPITREPFEPTDLVTRIDYCGHIFKRANLRLWLSIHSNCPMCRHNLREDLTTNEPRPTSNARGQFRGGIISPTYDRLWSEIRGTLDNINNSDN